VDRDPRDAVVLARMVRVEVAVRRGHELPDPMAERRGCVREAPLHRVAARVETGVPGADAGVEQEQPAVTCPEEMGDDDALLARPRLAGRERERPRVERQHLPELRVGHVTPAGQPGRSVMTTMTRRPQGSRGG